MDLFDVFSPEELESLSDDSRIAFSEIVRKGQLVLRERTTNLRGDDQESWNYLMEERHGFLNMVVAAGKNLRIAPFIDYQVPETGPFKDTDWREFRAELDHYMTQMALDNARRGRREGIAIPLDAKERIRKHIHALRGLIDKAEIDEKKKASMRHKLEQFEHELDKRRLPLGAVGLLALTLFTAPADLVESTEMVIQHISSIFQEVSDAKTIEDEQRQLPPITDPAMLSPPRAPKVSKESSATGFESGGMDDDIPF